VAARSESAMYVRYLRLRTIASEGGVPTQMPTSNVPTALLHS
jgi:hypothetical protein